MSPVALAAFLALAHVRDRPLAAALNAGLAALGVATAAALLLISAQIEGRIAKDGQGIDLVVGAKGSPLQLILSSVHHADVPVGNVSLSEARLVAGHPLVGWAVPLALGDSYGGYRIAGTTPEYAGLYGGQLREGAFWTRPLEVVLGADVARARGMAVGDQFVSSHGFSAAPGVMAHGHAVMTVTGVLAPTGAVVDRLILTSLDSVWIAHGEVIVPNGLRDDWALTPGGAGREITALLVGYSGPMGAVRLPREIEGNTGMMAAKPAEQLQRLFSLLGAGFDVMAGFAWVLVGAAGFGVLASMMGQMRERQRDIALMRVMGARRGFVLGQVMLEGVLVAGFGACVGLALGHLGAHGFGMAVAQARAAGVSGFVFLVEEILIVLGACGVGLLGAAVPAWAAYRVDLLAMVRR